VRRFAITRYDVAAAWSAVLRSRTRRGGHAAVAPRRQFPLRAWTAIL